MIFTAYIFKVNQECEKSIRDILRFVINRTQFKSGCIQSSLWSNDDSSQLMLYELWRSRSDLEKHMTTAVYGKLLVALEMGTEKPLIRFAGCVNIDGIELIENILTRKSDFLTQV